MRLSFRFIVLFLLIGLAGCATDARRPVPIADGKYIGIPFGPNGPENGKSEGYEVHVAGLAPGADEKTEVIYIFGISVPNGSKLKRVRVDDISEEQNGTLIDDTNPWVDGDRWVGRTAPKKSDDPLFKWVFTVTNSLRVYRFIVTDSTGHQVVMYHVVGYPDFRKNMLRTKWSGK
jgi:hypothetical protein